MDLKKILLLSAYDAVSHRVWRETLVDGLPEFRWSVLALPPRYFSWRIRGNALSWLRQPALDENYDLVVATSMSDLAGLKGLRRELSGIPAIVYFHENQFDYPAGQGKQGVEAQMVTLYSALAADKVAFNSSYNMEGFLQGVRSLLDRLPDCVPKGVVSRIEDRSSVIPVPIRSQFYCQRRIGRGSHPMTVVWNHRWEYDKGPDRLLALAGLVARSDLDVRFRITGQQFRQTPGEFERIRDLLGDRIISWGYINDSYYPRILRESDVVLSTALHDFQGLAVLEAVAAGCVPLVPDRLAYPEWFGEEFRYSSNPDDPQAEAQSAMTRLGEYANSFCGPRMCPPDVSWLSWEKLRSRYLDLLSF